MSLLVAGVLLIWPVGNKRAEEVARPLHRAWSIVVGGGLGLLSGMVGIGGGIFLAPLLLLLHWAAPKQVAAFSAVFILLNSLSGLAGQLLKDSAGFSRLAMAGAGGSGVRRRSTRQPVGGAPGVAGAACGR